MPNGDEMAFIDGMHAISKVLKVIAVATAVGAFSLGVAACTYGTAGISALFAGLAGAAMLFFLLWTPAWVIKKFVQ